MSPIPATLAEYHSQTDLNVPCEQSVRGGGGGASKWSPAKREGAMEFNCTSEFHHTLPQVPRRVAAWTIINPIFNGGKITFSLFTQFFSPSGAKKSIFQSDETRYGTLGLKPIWQLMLMSVYKNPKYGWIPSGLHELGAKNLVSGASNREKSLFFNFLRSGKQYYRYPMGYNWFGSSTQTPNQCLRVIIGQEHLQFTLHLVKNRLFAVFAQVKKASNFQFYGFWYIKRDEHGQ